MTRAGQKSEQLMRWAARASVTVALLLVTTKSVAWWQSSSTTMLGSLADSGLDLMASLVTLFAIRTALTPADDAHRFGHGKAEALAGLFQSAIMAGSAMFLLLESLNRIIEPAAIAHSDLVIGVSIFAIIASLLLVTFQSYVVRQSGSLAIAGDHLHYKGDLLMNLAVVVAAWLSLSGQLWADGVFGVLIALYIAYGAWEIVQPAIDMLMDKELSGDEREKIFNLVMASPGVMGLHDLRTRASGRDVFIQLHIELDPNSSLQEAYLIGIEVEAMLGECFPDADIFIHLDPFDPANTDRTFEEIV